MTSARLNSLATVKPFRTKVIDMLSRCLVGSGKRGGRTSHERACGAPGKKSRPRHMHLRSWGLVKAKNISLTNTFLGLAYKPTCHALAE